MKQLASAFKVEEITVRLVGLSIASIRSLKAQQNKGASVQVLPVDDFWPMSIEIEVHACSAVKTNKNIVINVYIQAVYLCVAFA